MPTYEVWSLDVWGHCISECHEYGCACMVDGAHDENTCQCCYDVNDRCKVGSIELANEDEALTALDAGGFIHANLCDTDDAMWPDIWIYSHDTGRPLLQLCEVES